MLNFSPPSTAEPFVLEIGSERVLEQARRKLSALPQSSATGIEWRIADKTVADSVRRYLAENQLGQIRVVHVP